MKFLCDFKLVSSLLAAELLRQCSSHSLSPSPLVFSSDMRPACRDWTAYVLPSFPYSSASGGKCPLCTFSAVCWLHGRLFALIINPSPPPPSEELGTVWKWFIFEKIYIPLQVCPLELCHVITKVCNHVWLRSSHCFPCKMLCQAAHLMFYYLTTKKDRKKLK